MNGTKKFLFSLATLAAMPGFADTNGPIIPPAKVVSKRFSRRISSTDQSQNRTLSLALKAARGVYIGSGDGTVAGDRLHGTIRWSLWSGNCLYPVVRSGQSVPEVFPFAQ